MSEEYISPDKYNSKKYNNENTNKKTISTHNYTWLVNAYNNNHKYLIGVQKIRGGGYGNDMLYEYKDGVWSALSKSDVTKTLSDIVTDDDIAPDPGMIEKAYRSIMISGERKDIETFNSNEDLVCFKNGVYRLSDGIILKHSPDYYFTLQLNANIPDDLDNLSPTPHCDLCLSNFGDKKVQYLLLQIFGATISNVHMYRFKKAVLQYGVGDSGKTQFKRLAERILGEGNFNNVDLADLENNRFLSAAFQNVRIGVFFASLFCRKLQNKNVGYCKTVL